MTSLNCLVPHLSPGDIIIDAGNFGLFDRPQPPREILRIQGAALRRHRREPAAKKARVMAPAIMPGGSPAAWPHVKDIFQGVIREGGRQCAVLRLGRRRRRGSLREDGPNGIEYGDMQLIGDGLQHFKNGLGHGRSGNPRGVLPNGTRANWIPISSRSPATSWRSKTPMARRCGQDPRHRWAERQPANGR